MMKLYLVRHGIAAPRGTPGVKDDDRALTEEGIEKMKQAAEGLSRLDCIPELILTSPLVRASQTAEILAGAFPKGIELKVTPSLAPSGARKDLYREIDVQAQKPIQSLMLVGHQPSLGEIAGEIAFGSPKHYIELKKGGGCAIELESLKGVPRGTMVLLLTPSVLRKIVV